jgi:hypothetical protein
MDGNDLSINVIEAKFSAESLSPQSAAVAEARHQVRSTNSLDHPLILRTRSRLARAITHRLARRCAGSERERRFRAAREQSSEPATNQRFEWAKHCRALEECFRSLEPR